MNDHSLKPGTLIVLEGLDKTGKSTQSDALRKLLTPDSTTHVHMPSGLSSFTRETYSMLESSDRSPLSGVAKQLTHLACHAESVPRIQDILANRAVVLDRWWWSTLAYGWHSGDFAGVGIQKESFLDVINGIWSPLNASVVFLFDKPYDEDSNNSDPILSGYHTIADEYPDLTVRVPQGEESEVTAYIVSALRARNLLK
ncbi:hypothetical protein ASF72_19260 [Arthrobacter sp. Leaf141]|uniref:dTMP kinase n=1 Tax=Micrococcaceae TaxID=1268 RepID=UPI0006F962BF|nr:hypothetical protein [Arthrobacter sp. Leaf141]KQQ96075.1 hypothetical protein ASF72_19260 [Arthrobacter sp. Leaf141]